MPRVGPIKRRDQIRYLQRCGFSGPYAGGRHETMRQGDISREFLLRILKEAGISRKVWEAL